MSDTSVNNLIYDCLQLKHLKKEEEKVAEEEWNKEDEKEDNTEL